MRNSNFLSSDYPIQSTTPTTSYNPTSTPFSSYATDAFISAKRYNAPMTSSTYSSTSTGSYTPSATTTYDYTSTAPLNSSGTYEYTTTLKTSTYEPTPVRSSLANSQIISASIEEEPTTRQVLEIPMPTLSWEQFLLINVEMDRLADLAVKCAKERDAWKAKHDEQVQANTEAERINRLKTEEFEAKLRKSAQEIGGLAAQLNQKTNEASSWKARFDEQVQITVGNERTFKSKIAELEQKITKIIEENKNLTTQLIEKTKQFDDKVKASEEYERITKSKIAELENNLSKMVEKNNSLTNQLVEKTKEVASWRGKFDEQVKANTENLRINKMRLSELESRIMNMTKDNQILAAQVAQKVEELTIWKLKFNEMELQAREFAAINQTLTQNLAESTEQLERVKRENRQLQLFIEEKYAEIQRLKVSLDEANEKIEYLDNEKLSLTILLNDQLAQMKELQAAFHEQNPGADHSKCCGQYKKIRAENNQKIKEDNEKKVRLARIDDTEKKLMKLLEQKKKLAQENERLEGVIIEKQKEAKGLRDSQLSSGSPTNNGKSPMSRSPRKLGSKSPISKMKESQGLSGFSAMVESMDNNDEEKTPKSPKKRQADSLTPSKSSATLGGLTPKSASIKPRNIYRLTVNDEKVDTRPQTTVPGDSLEGELRTMTQERDRLLELLSAKNKEIEGLKTQLVEAKFYEEQYEAMVREKESMSTVLTEKIESVEEMAFRLKEVEGELSQVVLQAKATLLASENEKLNADLNKKINNIEEWKSKLGVLESITSLAKKPDTKKQQKEESSNKVENKLKTSLVVSRIGNDSEGSANSDDVTQGSPTIEAAPVSFRLKLQS